MKKVFLAMIVTAAVTGFTACCNEKKSEKESGVEVKTDGGNTSINVSGDTDDAKDDDDKTEGTNVTIDKNGISVEGANGEKVKVGEGGVSVVTGDSVKTKVTTGGAGGVKVDAKGGVKVNAGGVKVDVGGGKVKIN